MLNRLVAVTVSALLPLSSLAQQPANPCGGPGYVIGYFNGLSTDPIGAQDGLDAIRAIYGSQYNNQPVGYALFYLPTDGLIQDVANAFAQRLQSSPGMTDRWELIWDTLDDGGSSITDLAVAENPSLGSFISDLKSAFLKSEASEIKALPSSTPFQPTVNQFSSVLTTYYTEQKKVLAFAHSQGNVYLNAAYDAVKPGLTTDSLRTVQVATPTATVRDPLGRYVTSTTDLVIQGLILTLGNTEPANTPGPILAALSRDTEFGHKFVDIYMNPKYSLLQAIKSLADSNLQALQTTKTQGSSGLFTVTLTWSGKGQEDLNVFEPNSTHVYYASKQGTTGTLDLANTDGGPEHYYATCDPSVIQTGTYRVGINNSTAPNGETASIQLISRDRVFPVVMKSMGPPLGTSGDSSPAPVFDVVVGKNTDGTYTVTSK